MALPPPSENQPYCNISALESGTIDLPVSIFATNADQEAVDTAPALSFLIQHSKRPEKMIYDLGIRKDWQNLTPTSVKWINEIFTVDVPQDVVDSLAKGGLGPSDIDFVCLGHLHFDHVGDTRPFTTSTFVVGAESATLLQSGYPTDLHSGIAQDLLPLERTVFVEIDDKWTPLGPFPRALDFYRDGSLYLVDAPGHLAGHLMILVRTSPDGAWVLLAGDSAHTRLLVTGEAEIATEHLKYRYGCAHADKDQAAENLARIREVIKDPRVRLILGHDEPWYRVNKNGPAFLPGKIPSL